MFFLIFYFWFSKLFNLPELSENDRVIYAIYCFFELILEIVGIVEIIIGSKRR